MLAQQPALAARSRPARCCSARAKPAGRYFVLLDGEVDILKALGTPDERLLAVRGGGTVVGELSLFSPGGRTPPACGRARALQVLEMTRAEFDALLHRHPSLGYGMVQTLSQRLIEAEQGTIRDLRAEEPGAGPGLRDWRPRRRSSSRRKSWSASWRWPAASSAACCRAACPALPGLRIWRADGRP